MITLLRRVSFELDAKEYERFLSNRGSIDFDK